MVIGSAKIPRYILRNGLGYANPPVSQTSIKIGSTVLYGFSDKPQYDVFIANSEVLLTPYPLVRGYLERMLDDYSVQLVVLDAGTSQQPLLQATTFQAILDALHNRAESVRVTHRLLLEEASSSYRIEEFAITGEPLHASVK